MRKGIHPEYVIAIARCTCGNTFETRSVKKDIKVDICSACHPFYTGQQKLIDTAGRIEKFKKKYKGNIVSKGTKKASKVRKQQASAVKREKSKEVVVKKQATVAKK